MESSIFRKGLEFFSFLLGRGGSMRKLLSWMPSFATAKGLQRGGNVGCKVGLAAMALLATAGGVAPSQAGTVTFGSGANTFNMEFVTIGNPGNAADTTGAPNSAGAVGYTYGIGKFEVSEDMIEKYNALNPGLQISKDTRGPNKPATGVSWNEAARFVNWLNTSTGNQAAYKFTTSGVNDNIALWQDGDAGYDVNNKYRNSLAKYFLPSYNEWYKAAYFKPDSPTSTTGTYYDFATGSDTAPTPVASGTGIGANGNNEAVYNGQSGPADVTQAGGLSPYGVMGLGGNVFEWEESSFNRANRSGSSSRGFRGGNWSDGSSFLSSSSRLSTDPSDEFNDLGFRVASLSSSDPPAVPEPTSMAIFGLGALGMAYRARRKSKA
jgi:formylglycine-generating enzyme required for sulfatase activity